MSTNPQPSRAELRRLAEARLQAQQKSDGAGAARSPEENRRVVHELQVHQIELEMQNEELLVARAELEDALGRLTDLYDHAPVGYLNLDTAGRVRTLNFAAAHLLRGERSQLTGRSLASLVLRSAGADLRTLVQSALHSGTKGVATLALLAEGEQFRYFQVEAVASENRQECRLALVEVTASKRAEQELERVIAELRAAQAEAKTLRGLLPICSSCKKIRDSDGQWRQFEIYIQTRTEATFTHGMCPACLTVYYPNLPQTPRS